MLQMALFMTGWVIVQAVHQPNSRNTNWVTIPPPEKDSAVSDRGPPSSPDTTVVNDEMKTETVEPPISTTSMSTQPDLAVPDGAPENGILSQIREMLNVSDTKNMSIMGKVTEISASISQVEDHLVTGINKVSANVDDVNNVSENMSREINTVSCNINDVSVKMTAKIDNVTTNMTEKFKDVGI